MPPPICPAPTTRTCSNFTPGGYSDFDQERVALPAAGTDRGQPQPAAVPAHLVHHRPDDSAAAGPDRVTERNGAAVHVRLLLVGPEEPSGVERDGRERLVDLDALHVLDPLPGLLQRL